MRAVFRYGDLIEVGATWERHRIDNRPRKQATYDVMAALCAKVLDPVHDKFGRPVLTYGFVSPALDKLVHRNPSPNAFRKGDQHAGCEVNGEGKPYCSRLGLAVDLRCPGIGSATVAKWVIENTAFDRLYFYDDTRPFHVSIGPARAAPRLDHPFRPDYGGHSGGKTRPIEPTRSMNNTIFSFVITCIHWRQYFIFIDKTK